MLAISVALLISFFVVPLAVAFLDDPVRSFAYHHYSHMPLVLAYLSPALWAITAAASFAACRMIALSTLAFWDAKLASRGYD